jgi:hypothetical protein
MHKQKKDKKEFNLIVQLETSHWQYEKQFINFSMFMGLVMLNVFRGSKVNPSVFGIKVCSSQDWFGIGLFVVYCMCVTYYSVMT